MLGKLSFATGDDAVAIGSSSRATTTGVAIGTGAQANGLSSISIGTGNVVNGARSGAIGDPSTINGANSYSVGNNNQIAAGQSDVFALGNNITSTISNSVALSSGSAMIGTASAQTAGLAAVSGATAGATPVGVVSVGAAGAERRVQNVAAGLVGSGSTDAVNGSQLYATNQQLAQISATQVNAVQYDSPSRSSVTYNPGGSAATLRNIAAGTALTDAVNVGQLDTRLAATLSAARGYTDTAIAGVRFDLNNVRMDSNAGTAGALAAAGMPQAFEAGKSMIAMGAGTFQGEHAVALGLSRVFDDGRTVLKAGGTYNSRKQVGVSAGVGYQF